MQDDVGPLLHQVASEIDQASNRILEEKVGIGLSQFRILLVLQAKDGVRQNQISLELGQTEASISRQIKMLDKRGLVRVLRSSTNRREKRVFITDKGNSISDKSREILNKYHAPLFAGLSEKDQWQLVNSLQKIKQYLKLS
jgi:MarR family transcriptional regulator, transcriptional regulator for hemolysin